MKDQDITQRFSSSEKHEENQMEHSGVSLAAPNYAAVSQMSAVSSLPAVSPSPIVNIATVQKKSFEGEEEISLDSEVMQAKLATNEPPPYNNDGKPASIQMKKSGATSTDSEQAMAESLARKSSNANYITDEIFFARHKDMPRRKLQKRSSDPKEQALVKEWLQIKSGIVIPAIQKVRNGGEEDAPEKEKPGKDKPENGKPGEGKKGKEDPKDGGGKEIDKPGGGTESGEDSSKDKEGGEKEKQKEGNGEGGSGGDSGGSGEFDWVGIGGNLARTVLEIGRLAGPITLGPLPIPLGPACGLAANSINAYQDYVASCNLDDNGLIVLTGIRNGANILGGLAGDLSYCTTIIQDLLAGTVIGVELVPVTMAINEVLDLSSAAFNLVKVAADSATMSYSIVRSLQVEALDPVKAEAYRSMATGYLANTIADNISLFFDLVDIMSGGVFQGEIGDKVVKASTGITEFGGALGKFAARTSKGAMFDAIVKNNSSVKNLFLKAMDIGIGIWGGNLGDEVRGANASDTEANPVQPMLNENEPAQLSVKDSVQDFTGDYILNELKTVEYIYNLGSDGINAMPGHIRSIMNYVEEHAKEITGSEDPFKVMMGMVTGEMENLENQLTGLAQSKEAISQLEIGLNGSYEYLQALENAIDNLQMPEIDIFEDKDIGDNPVADMIEGVVNAGQDVAEEALQFLLDQVQEQIDKVKEIVRGVIQKVMEELDFCYQWMSLLMQTIDEQIIFVRDLIANVREKLESCKNFEDIFNAMLASISEVLGLEDNITIDSIVEKWNEFDAFIKASIDFAQAWVNANVKANPNPAQQSKNDGSSIETSGSTTNQDLEPGFKSSVEKHTNTPVSDFSISKNDKRADNMGAKAYNQGNDLVFGQGQYNPSSKSGKFLIAHEMAHSMQNSNLKATSSKNGMNINDDPSLESEADTVAKKIVDDSDK